MEWKPSRGATILLGLLTVWPLIYGALFMVFMATIFMRFGSGAKEPPMFVDFFRYIFVLHCATILLSFALTGTYVFHAYRTTLIPNDRRVIWIIILVFGNMMAFPIYWYVYLWKPLRATPELPQ